MDSGRYVTRTHFFTLCLVLFAVNQVWQAQAQDAFSETCVDCHNGTADSAGKVPPATALAQSVHADMDCTDCHSSFNVDDMDMTQDCPHAGMIKTIGCAECHEDEAADYVMHGSLVVGQDPDIPSCWSCHGTHDIRHSDDRESQVHPSNLPHTCRSCHTNVDLVKKHDVLREEPISLYENSVHGKASRKGLYVSATCNDCHSATDENGNRTAHRVLSGGNPQSTIYHFNIPNTCGQCHKSVKQDFWDGIHGQRVKQGRVDAPVCTHCHGEHGIIAASDPRSPVSAARLAEATCAPCHESQVLNEKYGVPTGRLRSYVDSYHGLKAKAGDVHVANCASCHGSHRVLPHTDPTSSINAANLSHTCGECHPGISRELANTPIHSTATGVKTGWPHFFTVFYLWMIGVTIGLMVLHNIADWFRHVKLMTQKPFVVRMSTNETMQHWVLMISFLVLVITGFSLRFSESFWVDFLFGWGGGKGFLFRGLIHRIAAVIFMIWAVWHLLYLFSARGRRYFKDMLAGPKDLRHIGQSIRFFLGFRPTEPGFGRFTYMEKCEYWALLWGTFIMVGTGVLLWFDNYFVERWGLPKGVLDVMLVVHYYEAWLATLAIFVWHLYGTIFRPSVYPMNPAWMAGRMPRDQYNHEHPEGPRLKSHQYVFRVEDEEEESGADTKPDDHRGSGSPHGSVAEGSAESPTGGGQDPQPEDKYPH